MREASSAAAAPPARRLGSPSSAGPPRRCPPRARRRRRQLRVPRLLEEETVPSLDQKDGPVAAAFRSRRWVFEQLARLRVRRVHHHLAHELRAVLGNAEVSDGGVVLAAQARGSATLARFFDDERRALSARDEVARRDKQATRRPTATRSRGIIAKRASERRGCRDEDARVKECERLSERSAFDSPREALVETCRVYSDGPNETSVKRSYKRNPRSPFRSRPSRGVRRRDARPNGLIPRISPLVGVSPSPRRVHRQVKLRGREVRGHGGRRGQPAHRRPALARSKPTGVWLAPCVSFLSPPPSPPAARLRGDRLRPASPVGDPVSFSVRSLRSRTLCWP